MTECHCEGMDEDHSECRAEWYDFEQNFYDEPCHRYHEFVECMDYDHSMDECHFEECSDDGNCWQEICNEHAENYCQQPTCQVWKYNEREDFWDVHDCPEDEWEFGDHFSFFREHYHMEFKKAFAKACPGGYCFENFTDNYVPFFDNNDEEIDAFLMDDEAVDIAHGFVDATEDAFGVELDAMHGLLEQDDHEDMKDAIDAAMTMWAQGFMNEGVMRKGSRRGN